MEILTGCDRWLTANRSDDNGTGPLDPRIEEIQTYYGREYQRESLRREISLCPVDDVSRFLPSKRGGVRTKFDDYYQKEIGRLETQHHMLKLVFNDKPEPLFLPPITDPEEILDCGHGAGFWAQEVAERDPDCSVRRLLTCQKFH